MEAKDTVMSDIALLQSFLGLPDASTITEYAASQDMNTPPGLYFKNGAKTQAEISFPLGKQEGIREVVELMVDDTNNFELPLSLGCIAKLKEWGI